MTIFHEALGAKRIKDICEKSGLTFDDVSIFEQTLKEWEKIFGNLDQMVAVAFKISGSSPRHREILAALKEVFVDFIEKRGNS